MDYPFKDLHSSATSKAVIFTGALVSQASRLTSNAIHPPAPETGSLGKRDSRATLQKSQGAWEFRYPVSCRGQG